MNTKRNYPSILTRAKLENPELRNTNELLQCLSKPYTVLFLETLSKKPQRYSELRNVFSITHNSERSVFNYYLKRTVMSGLASHDRMSGVYKITFRGIKAIDLLRLASSLANLSIATVDDEDLENYTNLEQNKSWLEPLLKKEIRNILSELKVTNP